MPFDMKFIIFWVGFSIDCDRIRFPCKSKVKLVHLIQLVFGRVAQSLFGTVERREGCFTKA